MREGGNCMPLRLSKEFRWRQKCPKLRKIVLELRCLLFLWRYILEDWKFEQGEKWLTWHEFKPHARGLVGVSLAITFWEVKPAEFPGKFGTAVHHYGLWCPCLFPHRQHVGFFSPTASQSVLDTFLLTWKGRGSHLLEPLWTSAWHKLTFLPGDLRSADFVCWDCGVSVHLL